MRSTRSSTTRADQFNSARHLCDKCHSANLTGLRRGEWIAPPERMDWTDLNARDTCPLKTWREKCASTCCMTSASAGLWTTA